MIAPNYSKFCLEAERYYYDLLRDAPEQSVPPEIISHIVSCTWCRAQMNQLENMLSSGTNVSQKPKAVSVLLKLQFSYIGRQVSCMTVRPFMPCLLNPELRIGIPTPITAHLDNCEQCRDDLKKLKSLNLSPKHLITLGQMFADDFSPDKTRCAAAHAAILPVVLMAFNQTDANILKHLCLCPACRGELYKFRDEFLQQAAGCLGEDDTSQKQLYCPSITSNDIFDYCIPYGIDPANDEYAKFRKSLTSHIVGCTDCLGKIQQLHNTIYEIMDKQESGVITVLHPDTSDKTEQQAEPNNFYAGFPVKVEVSNSADMPVREKVHYPERIQRPASRKSFSNNLRPFIKAALPIAAVIIVVLGLLHGLPFAKALTIEQIYTSFDKAKNIYIARFEPDKDESIQEIYISRSAEIYITKSKTEFILWNIPNNIVKTKHLATDTIEQTYINSEVLEKIKIRIYGSLGIMPFRKSSDIPKDAQWSEITDSAPGSINTNIKLYELSWTEKATNEYLIQRRWRVFMDVSTMLPRRIQWFKQSSSDVQPLLESIMVIEYPSDEEVLSKVESFLL